MEPFQHNFFLMRIRQQKTQFACRQPSWQIATCIKATQSQLVNHSNTITAGKSQPVSQQHTSGWYTANYINKTHAKPFIHTLNSQLANCNKYQSNTLTAGKLLPVSKQHTPSWQISTSIKATISQLVNGNL